MHYLLRTFALFFVLATSFFGVFCLSAASQDKSRSGDLGRIHALVYQEGFSRKGLSQALALSESQLEHKPSGEAFLYKAMALYRLRRFQDSYRAARAGLQWLERQEEHKVSNKARLAHYIREELLKLQNQAQGRLPQETLRQKLQQK